MVMKNSNPRGIKAGDYVTFHTVHGHRTGIVEYIKLDSKEGNHYPIAVITVRTMGGKIKRYTRLLFKLHKATG